MLRKVKSGDIIIFGASGNFEIFEGESA